MSPASPAGLTPVEQNYVTVTLWTRSIGRFIAKFHYTCPTRARPDPNGPEWTRTDFVGDPHGPNGVSPQKSRCGSGRVRSGPCRARVVEFSSSPTMCADFFWSGPVRSGRVRSGPVGPV